MQSLPGPLCLHVPRGTAQPCAAGTTECTMLLLLRVGGQPNMHAIRVSKGACEAALQQRRRPAAQPGRAAAWRRRVLWPGVLTCMHQLRLRDPLVSDGTGFVVRLCAGRCSCLLPHLGLGVCLSFAPSHLPPLGLDFTLKNSTSRRTAQRRFQRGLETLAHDVGRGV